MTDCWMDGPPQAVIQRTGRWMHYVNIHHGLMEFQTGWFVLGRRRAERLAERKLRAYIRREQRRANPVIITLPEEPA